ncbi:MAG: hypothetical protein RLZZ623_1199 [Actinomycetota bacterium]
MDVSRAGETSVSRLQQESALTRLVCWVDLPAGWTIAVPSGAQASSYDYTISNGVAGAQTTIVSTPSATAATAFALYGPPAQVQRADFDGHAAWYSTYLASNNGTQGHLTWEAAGNAYDITARDATEDQLSLSHAGSSRSRSPTSKPPPRPALRRHGRQHRTRPARRMPHPGAPRDVDHWLTRRRSRRTGRVERHGYETVTRPPILAPVGAK